MKYKLDVEIDGLTNSIQNTMPTIKEPAGVDLNIGPMPVKEVDRKIVSAIIAHYKKTGEVLEVKGKKLQKKAKIKTQTIGRQ